LDDIGGTIRGYRVFTACRTVNGKIFRLEDHLERLYRSAEGIYMQPPMPSQELRTLLAEILHRNQERAPHADLQIDVVFSGGLQRETMKQSGTGAHLYVAVLPLVQPSPELYTTGVALATFPHQRMWAEIKLLNYVAAILAHQTVVPQHNAYDVLYVDPTDRHLVLEGSTFTVFFVDPRGHILTPPLDGHILDSVTRRALFEILLPRRDMTIRESPIPLREMPSFQEAFIASTTRSVLPVVRIDETVIGEGKPGPVTRAAMSVFQQYLESY
jgi:branched-chain amino acid aminotransferase